MNRSRTRLLIAVLAGLGSGLWADEPPPELHDGAYLHEIRTEIETPHVKWLKPGAGPAPKVLFLVHRVWGNSTAMRSRDVVEVWQRMDLEYEAFVFITSESERDRWEYNIAGSSTGEKREEAIRKLKGDYDAIVLIDFVVGWLPEEARNLLRSKVQAGCGLVLANKSDDFPWPLEAIPDSTGFMEGVPLTQIPAYGGEARALGEKVPSWEEVAPAVGQAYRFGQGRVARINPGRYGVDPEDETHLEYGCSLYIRALQWVVPGLKPAFAWKELPEGAVIPRADLPLDGLPLTVHSTLPRSASVRLDMAIRNRFNEVEHESWSEPTLEPGDNALEYALPLLPAGRHFLDLWIRSANGIEQYGSVGLTVSSPVRIDSIVFDSPFHRLGDENADVSVALTSSLAEAAEVRLTATDTYGRLIADVTAPVAAGAAAVAVRLPLSLTVAMAQWVRAELRRDGQVLDMDQELLIVGRSGPPEYPSILWNGTEGGLHGLRQLRRQREAGFNLCLSHVDFQGNTARTAALADMQMFIYATHVSSVSDGVEGKATNPEYMRTWKEKVLARTRHTAPYTPYVYSLGDECHAGGAEQPFAPSDVAAFREFLKTRYRDLADLNQVWGTAYASFDEIEPVDWDKAEGAAFHPQKHERASFVEMLYARMMHAMDAALTGMDPTARVGAEGSRPGDLELTLEGLEVWGPYADRRFDVLLTSLAPRDLVQGMWWGGYHTGSLPRWKRIDRLWTMILEGVCNTNYFFDGLTGHHEGNASPDLSWAGYFERNIPELRTIYEGPGPLLSAAGIHDNGVALLWSQASEHAGGFYDAHWKWVPSGLMPFPPSPDEMKGMFAPLDASGVNYRFITDRQLVRDGLRPGEVKLLLLPMTTAVSRAVAAELESYVERGGVLLSVGSSGLMDEHCRILERGRLDNLLGLRRAGPAEAAEVGFSGRFDLLGTPLEAEVPGMIADASLRPDGAAAVVSAGEVPLLLVKEVGKGAAVHLNGSFAHLARRGDPGVDAARGMVSALLARAGVTRLFALEPPEAARAYAFTLGDVVLLSVIRRGDLSVPASIRLNASRHLYDTMSGRYIGRGREIQLASEGRGFELYCLAVDRLPGIALDVPGTALRGEMLGIEARLPGGRDRLVRMDVYDPAGEWRPYYRRFASMAGDSAGFTVPLAHNDLPGAWTVRVTDVASGSSEEHRVALE